MAGCRRKSPNTLVTSGSPGSPWIGRPSTSSEVMIAALSLWGAANQRVAATCHSLFVREKRARGALAPFRSMLMPACAITALTSAKAARYRATAALATVSSKATAASTSELSTASRRLLLPSDYEVNAFTFNCGCRSNTKPMVRRITVSTMAE